MMNVLLAIFEVTGILTFLAGVVLAITRGGRVYDAVIALSKLRSSLEAIVGMQGKIEEVVKEFRPNGGASMRDTINRLEAAHKVIDADNKKQLLLVNEVKSDVAKLSARLESTK
jgi:hypothetical protein